MSINHAQIRAFHAVARAGGFIRASADLNVTQPTLSGQVAALEEIYGVRLFERRGRGSEPTDLGRSLFAITSRMFSQEAEAEQLLAAARGLATGQLRVGADAPYTVIPLLATFNRRFPGIRLSLSFGNSERVLQELIDRRSDIAMLPELKPDPRLHAIPYRRDRLIAFVERGHPWASRRSVRLAELSGQRLVLREAGSVTRALFEHAMAQANLKPGAILEIGSREAVREAVAAGLGIGIIFASELGTDDRLHGLRLRDVEVESTEYAACLTERQSVRAVRAFFELLGESTPA